MILGSLKLIEAILRKQGDLETEAWLRKYRYDISNSVSANLIRRSKRYCMRKDKDT
jgi:hypothetical protein